MTDVPNGAHIGSQWCQKLTRNQVTWLMVLCDLLTGQLGTNHSVSKRHISSSAKGRLQMTSKSLSCFKTLDWKPNALESGHCRLLGAGQSPSLSEPGFSIFEMRVRNSCFVFSQGN